MAIKHILALAQHRAPADGVIQTAVGLAERLGAAVACVYVIPPADGPRFAGGLTLGAVMTEITERDATDAATLRSSFEKIAHRHGIRTEWRLATGIPNDQVLVQARYTDLVVVSHPGFSRSRTHVPVSPIDMLHGVGGPMLIIPSGSFRLLAPRRAVVAWNASREAKRAVSDALPILETLEAVDIVVVNPGYGHEGLGGHGPEPGADIADYLSRHGLRPEVHVDHTKRESVGARLLTWVERLQADIIVAGAFGHSRVREAIIGSVTQHLLHVSNVPVFMSR